MDHTCDAHDFALINILTRYLDSTQCSPEGCVWGGGGGGKGGVVR